MYERFTDRARKVMQLANEEALQLAHEYIGTEHVLLGLVDVQGGIAGEVLGRFGVDQERIRLEISKIIRSGSRAARTGKLPQTPRAKKVIEFAMEEARLLDHEKVDIEHFLLALVREGEGVAAQVLGNLGLSLNQCRREVLAALGQEPNGDFMRAEGGPRLSVSDSSVFRILDAAANRAAEGLRVVEDFARFVLDDAFLTRLVKELRHDLAESLTALPRGDRHTMRETQQDVGTDISTPAELQRTDAAAVCEASCERVKQSLRSLEEYSKVETLETAAAFESLRYQFYTIEKALSTRLRSSGELDAVHLCVLIDGAFTDEAVRQLLAAGVRMIQLREKTLSDRELLKRARTLYEAAKTPSPIPSLEGRGTPLIIVNDRADIAATADADGVHLGQDDLSVKAAREILGPRKIIGVSTHSIEQARQAVLDGANYIGVGPTFPSTTKEFDAFTGTTLLKQVADEISLPAFAIGGIMLENLDEVLATGIKRVAVSGAITKAAEPENVARAFLSRLQS